MGNSSEKNRDVNECRLVASLISCNIYVDQFGNAFIKDTNHVMVPLKTLYKRSEGWAAYIQVKREGRRRHVRISRLVAEAWMDDFNPKKHVFHHDKDASNNHIHNLYQRVDHE